MTSSNVGGLGSAEPTPDPQHSSGPDPQEKLRRVADSAMEEGSNVADTAKDEAQQVLGEAKDKATDLLDEAKSQVDEQSRVQLQSIGTKLKELSDELDGMVRSSDAQGAVAELARQLSTKTRSLSSQLSDREPGELVNEIRRFARQRPGTFLIGAAAAGVIAGRLTRGAKDSNSGSRPAPPPAHARAAEPLPSDPWTSAGGVR